MCIILLNGPLNLLNEVRVVLFHRVRSRVESRRVRVRNGVDTRENTRPRRVQHHITFRYRYDIVSLI